MIKVENPEACTGCLICEMICSFHHIRKFSRSHSSIKVNKSIFNLDRRAQITIYNSEEDPNRACDLCNTEDSPLCVRYCPEDVLKSEVRK